MSRTQLCLVVGTAAIIVFALVNAAGLYATSVDDAYISLRYAWNLVEGNGLVWNVGERVEGFSNPVFTLLCALPIAAGLDGLQGAKLIGLSGLALTIVGVVGSAVELARPKRFEEALALVIGAGVLAVSLPGVTWATGGLEGTQYAACLALATWLLLREERVGGPPISALLAGLAAISRPEAPLLVLGFVAFRGYRAWKEGAFPKRWLALFSIPTLGYLFFRLAYYGALLPNTTWRKVHRGWDFAVFWDYVGSWVTLEWPLLVAGIAGLVLLRWRGAFVAWMVGAQFLFLFGVGTDWMEGWRFVLPAIPGLAIGLAAGACVLARRKVWAQAAVAGVVSAVAIASVGMEQGRNLDVVHRSDEHTVPASLSEDWEGSMSYALAYLAGQVPPGATVAYTEIGIVGYGSDWEVLDLAGLTSREVAGATGMELDEVVDWLGEEQPDVIVLKERGWDLLGAVRKSTWLEERYTQVTDEELRGILVYRRNDVGAPTPAEQLATLETAVERAPRFKLLHQRRVRIAKRYGTPEQLFNACADLSASLPTLELDTCEGRVNEPPRATLELVPAAQAAESVTKPVPIGEAIEWVVKGEGATVEDDRVSLRPGNAPYTVCEPGRPSVKGPVRVTGRVRSDAVSRENVGAQVQLRWFDGQGVYLDGTLAVAHQAVGSSDWSDLDATFAPPEGAEKVRLCMEFGATSGLFEVESLQRL